MTLALTCEVILQHFKLYHNIRHRINNRNILFQELFLYKIKLHSVFNGCGRFEMANGLKTANNRYT